VEETARKGSEFPIISDRLGPLTTCEAKRQPLQRLRSEKSEKFFVGVELAIFGSVVEGNVAVGALFELVDFAGVERLGVNVNADGALIVFGEIENLMDGFERVDVTGIGGVHFVDVGGNEFAGAGVVGKSVTVRDAEILDF